MPEEINIYCDESCHLENEQCKVMVVSCLRCHKESVREISEKIREIKQKHKIWKFAEIKWSKVSKSKENFYFELLDYFLEENDLKFRAIIIDKNILEHKKYNQTHTQWYYKMVYELVEYILKNSPKEISYNVYTDKKENSLEARISLLKAQECLSNYHHSHIKVQNTVSHQSEVLQLNDFLQGMVSFHNRQLHLNKNSNKTKIKLIESLIERLSIDLTQKNWNEKFNLLTWGKY